MVYAIIKSPCFFNDVVCVGNHRILALVFIISPVSFCLQLQDWKCVLDTKSIS